jgi:hypothetical protein
MRGKTLQDTAGKRAKRLRAAELTHPFGPDREVPGTLDRCTGDRARR